MKSSHEILNRVTLIMNYDSAKTLYENKKDLKLIDEAGLRPTAEKVARELGIGLKDAEGATGRAAADAALLKGSLDSAARKVGYQLVRNDNSLIVGINELESTLLQPSKIESVIGKEKTMIDNPKAISSYAMGLLSKELLMGGNISKELKGFLINDLISSEGFIKKYRYLDRNEMKSKLDKVYKLEGRSDEIADTYMKTRGYDKPPTTAEEIATAKKAAENAKSAENVAAIAGKEGETIGKTEAEIAAAKEAERIASLGKEGFKKQEIIREYDRETGVLVKETTINYDRALKTLEQSSPGSIEDQTKRIFDNLTEVTDPKILSRFGKGYKVYFLRKLAFGAGITLGLGVMIGVAYIIIKRKLGLDKIALLKPNGDVYGDNDEEDPSGYDSTWANPGGFVDSNDMSAAKDAEDERQRLADEAERQRLASQQQAPSSLSMSNIANSFGKTIPAAQTLSPEEKDHLINNIRNGKRYVGADLNPAQRAFVDQYMKNIESRLPSKEKTKYIKNEPVRQNIKYGKKI